MKFYLGLLLGSARAFLGSVPSSISESKPMPDIAAIMSVPQDSFRSYKVGGLKRDNATLHSHMARDDAPRWDCSTRPILTWGGNDDGGRGMTITNAGNDWRSFYIYHNSCDQVPWKYIWIEAGKTQFVSFPERFEDRIQHGVDQYMPNGQVAQPLGSWLEISWYEDNVGWADISLIRGCDGAILTWSLDGVDKWKGFKQRILDDAPYGAYDKKDDGQWVIKATEGVNATINTIPHD